MTDVRQWLQQLSNDDVGVRNTAREALLGLDEEAINPLTDAFHSGVNEADGLHIFEVVAEIGGPDALTFLRGVYHFEDKRASWKQAAAQGLMLNRDNLDASEVDMLKKFLVDNS